VEITSIDDALDLAITREEASIVLYSRLARQATRPGMQEALFELVTEERSHRARLERARGGRKQRPLPAPTAAVSMVEDDLAPGSSYAEVLRFAIGREERSIELYHGLAEASRERELARLFLELAGEEEGHRARLEAEYLDVLEGV
jgi:rubrerythrin